MIKNTMQKKIKIGFQGDIGSNSEEAAQKFALKLKLKNVEYIPLISSKNVVDALLKQKINYGVMAIKNILAGPVVETQNALTKEIDKIDTLDLDIHHFLFTKTKSSNIQYVASHIQALNQTKRTREKLIPNAIEIECADTALAATLLANGTYSENYAIICRKNIGLFYNLFLFAENIEDDSRNKTTFGLFQLKN